MSLRKHIVTKHRTAMFNLLLIKNIRHMFTIETCHVIMLILVILHLDNMSAIMAELPDLAIKMLPQIQNMAAKLLLERKHGNSASECLQLLGWLPIRQGIKHKILTLTHDCIHKCAPNYLQDLLTEVPYQGCNLRSNMYKNLVVAFTKHQTFTDRLFSVCISKWAKSLLNSIKMVAGPTQFKKGLKNYLLKEAYTLLLTLTYLKFNLHLTNSF